MPSRTSRRSPADLPQSEETWSVLARKLKIWIRPPEGKPSRPYCLLVIDRLSGVVVGAELTESAPTPQDAWKVLFKAMKYPPKEWGQTPHRPRRVEFDDSALLTALRPDLENLSVDSGQGRPPQELDEIVEGLETHLRGGLPEHPGLQSVRGVTPALLGGLYSAAAEFYRAAPWVHLYNVQTFALRVSPERDFRFAQVLGNAGVEYGLAMYRRWEDVMRMFQPGERLLEFMPEAGAHSFMFGDISLVPFDDLEAIERYGWEVAGEDAYPIPIVYTKADGAKRPTRADLRWYEAALRAMPILVRDYLRPDGQGDYLPVETTLTVPTHAGPVAVEAKYPGGVLDRRSEPAQRFEWEPEDEEDESEAMPAFDRRAMEGMMAKMARDMGAEPGSEDPKLEQAQALMYQAWEESNPAKRIALAHRALSVSPNCADAYVLLAEEEADTVDRALHHYHEGVKAGEQALGREYFEENAGHFWGLLETRPYMRARHGLADTLWRIGRREEAMEHYREMLRLNPSDNQGIRYLLANLLLGLDRDDELRALLKQYDDGMANWLYTRALVEFRQGGATASAERALQAALKENPHAPAYLIGRKRIPNRLPAYIGIGDENEAIAYASDHLNHWRRSPGAVDWLKEHLDPSGKPSPVPKPKTKSRPERKKAPKRKTQY